jgi:hypothetical protein
MAVLSEVAISALEPLLGPTVASTCIRASALSIGKLANQLDESDLPMLESNIRRVLAAVAPAAAIDAVLAQIKGAL